MSEDPSLVSYLPYALPCASIVYRMIPTASMWIADDGSLDPSIFYRIPSDKKDGVSVSTSVESGIERMKKVKRPIDGILSLHVGRVRDIDPLGKLNVRSRSTESTHAAITGLPFMDEDVRESERLAYELLKTTRRVPLP